MAKKKAAAPVPWVRVSTTAPVSPVELSRRNEGGESFRLVFPHPDFPDCAALVYDGGTVADSIALSVSDCDWLSQACAWMGVEMERRGLER